MSKKTDKIKASSSHPAPQRNREGGNNPLTEEKTVSPGIRRSDDIDLYVASRIRERRQKLNKSQQDVAEYLGISYQQLQKYETGINRIAAGKLYALAVFLDVRVSYFFMGLEGEGLSPFGGEASATMNEIEDLEVRKAVAVLIDAIADSGLGKS